MQYFFGYGSLVNASTHDFAPCHAARLTGWRRAWIATAERRLAYLSVVPDPTAAIDGLIAPVPAAGWAALDRREAAYERVAVAHQVDTSAPDARDITVYSIAPARRLPPSRAHPVLLSYIDVVIQGYLHRFGPDGAQAFFETTSGWDAPVIDDRAAPRYARARRLTGPEAARVDAALRALGVTRLAPSDVPDLPPAPRADPPGL